MSTVFFSPSTRLQVLHECAECTHVGVARVRRERRENLHARSVGELRARETLLIALHPRRHVGGHAVLPRAEPEDHELEIVRARIAQQFIDRGPVEFSFGGLDEFPRHRREHGVEIHRLQARPVRAHVLRARGAGIAELAAQDQERLAVDDELLRAAVFREMRRRGVRGDAAASAARTTMRDFHAPDVNKRVHGLREKSSAAQSTNTRTLVDRWRFAG